MIDARGKAVAPGFINMLSWSNESLLQDGLGQSELRQGVTLEVMGEGDSMGPLNETMKRLMVGRQAAIHHPMVAAEGEVNRMTDMQAAINHQGTRLYRPDGQNRHLRRIDDCRKLVEARFKTRIDESSRP